MSHKIPLPNYSVQHGTEIYVTDKGSMSAPKNKKEDTFIYLIFGFWRNILTFFFLAYFQNNKKWHKHGLFLGILLSCGK